MGKLGFGTRWIDWIRELVSTISYSVIVEGQPFGYFKPEREDNCENILNLLNSYEGYSGQQINLDKSAVFFSNNTPPHVRIQVAGKLNIHHIGVQDKYLGLPSLIHKSKRETFSEIKEKVRKKVNGWQRNLLSTGGKQRGNERRMAWISWNQMTRPKREGGLGFKDLRAQNLALLGKQFWRITTKPQSILAQIYREKYYRYGNSMNAEAGNSPSWGWRSMLEGKKVVEKGLNWRVGSGSTIRIFADLWLPPPYPMSIAPKISTHSNSGQHIWVRDLLTENREWKQDILNEIFSPEVRSRILSIKPIEGNNVLQWSLNKSRLYDVASGYQIAYQFFYAEPEI
ncbi:uncharacterized protein LOC130980418 [Arachis stenosperma]|uniref:uncharacterized protein LOC130980418 n=1 Tax=Arachis stenosperma TaxID=217475 RepID=UPI0025ACF1C4|nr:uncharacterized protein LOC130980418 [Arachis stenosperma]